jgi:cell surface protein SprA
MSSDQGGLPTLAEANSSLQYRGDLKFQINKFMPDEWKVSLPLSLSYVANADRPWLKPQSDLSLSHDDLGDLAGDLLMLDRQLAIADSIEEELLRRQLRSKGWQDWRQTRSFSLSYKKDYVKSKELWREMLGQILFDRPTFNWRWSQSTLYGSQAIDTTDSYNTRFAYALGRLGPQRRRFFNPWPETFNLLLLDFNFSRNKNQIPKECSRQKSRSPTISSTSTTRSTSTGTSSAFSTSATISTSIEICAVSGRRLEKRTSSAPIRIAAFWGGSRSPLSTTATGIQS